VGWPTPALLSATSTGAGRNRETVLTTPDDIIPARPTSRGAYCQWLGAVIAALSAAASDDPPRARFVVCDRRRICARGRPGSSGSRHSRHRAERQDHPRARTGINSGSALSSACYGALPMVAGRILANWDLAYHPSSTQHLHERLAARCASADLRPLDRMLDRNGYADNEISRVDRRRGKSSRVRAATPRSYFALSEHPAFPARDARRTLLSSSSPVAPGWRELRSR
jgi:hypothetical protein